jgi:tetratricopeptide (TPR) repeat protein
VQCSFHLTNVALHAANSALVAALAWAFTSSAPAALLSGLFFAVHPVHVESVAFVSARSDLWAGLFSLTSALLWWRVRSGRAARPKLEAAASAGALTLGALSKEIAFALPPLLLAWQALRGASWQPAGWLRQWRWLLLWAGALGAALLLRHAAGIGFGLAWDAAGHSHLAPVLRQPLLMVGLWVTYFRLLVVPWPLRVFYTPSQLQVSALSLAGAAALVLLCAAVAGRSHRRAGLFSLAWIVFLLLPVAGLVPLRGASLVAERFAYLPSAGAAVAFGAAAAAGARRFGAWAVSAAATALMVFFALAFHRCAAWRDNLALFSDAAQASPQAAVAHNNLGVELSLRGRGDEAIGSYRTAISLAPDYGDPYANLGLELLRAGAFAPAVAALERAAELRPWDAAAFVNLARALDALGLWDRARSAYHAALRVDPRRSDALAALVVSYQRAGDRGAALQQFRALERIDPTAAAELRRSGAAP